MTPPERKPGRVAHPFAFFGTKVLPNWFQIAKPDLIVMAPFASQTSIRASIICSS
jgi:hypothetical protein